MLGQQGVHGRLFAMNLCDDRSQAQGKNLLLVFDQLDMTLYRHLMIYYIHRLMHLSALIRKHTTESRKKLAQRPITCQSAVDKRLRNSQILNILSPRSGINVQQDTYQYSHHLLLSEEYLLCEHLATKKEESLGPTLSGFISLLYIHAHIITYP